MVLDSGDLLRPGNQALVRYSGSVLAFGFGECFEGVLQLLLQCGPGHNGRLSLERGLDPGHLPMQSTGGARQRGSYGCAAVASAR